MKFAAGVALASLGSFLGAVGYTVQKWSFVRQEKLPEEKRVHYLKQPLWYLGILCLVLGAVSDFSALGVLYASTVSQIGVCVMLVSNTTLGRLFLKEFLNVGIVVGCGMILAGTVLGTVFREFRDVEYTVAVLKSYYAMPAFIVFGIILVILASLLYAYLRKVRTRTDAKSKALLPILNAILSGMFGSTNTLFAKSVSVLVATSFAGQNQFVYVEVYIFIICFLMSTTCQLHFQTMSLQTGSSLLAVPVFNVSFVLFNILMGGFYFREFTYINALGACMLVVGLVLFVIGVFILQRGIEKRDNGYSRRSSSAIELHTLPDTADMEA